jgi:hypothetical protein
LQSEDRVFDFRPQTQPAPVAEVDHFPRVAEVRRKYASVLGQEEYHEGSDDRSYNTSMTLYTNKTDLGFLQKTYRPMSAGVLSASGTSRQKDLATFVKLEQDKHNGLADLFETKKKLGKFNLPCTMRTLEAGLLKPEDLPLDRIAKLPSAGALLMSNPLEKLKKGKAKRKRGKRGKRGRS